MPSPMTLGNMRANGVHTLDVRCLAFCCGHSAILDVSGYGEGAVSRHLPPRPKAVPNAPGMFAFADPERVTEVLTAAGWAAPRLEKLDLNLDIAAGRGPDRDGERPISHPP